MNPGHWRQLQIIRPLAAASLAAAAFVPAGAAGQQLPGGPGAPCVSCLVIGVDAADLASLRRLATGSLEGVQLMLTGLPPDEIITATGVPVAVLVTPSTATGVSQIVFDARTTITALRAERPGMQIVIDGDAFAGRGVPLDELRPYVDAVVRGPDGSAPLRPGALRPGVTWTRLQPVSSPTVDDLVAASLTPRAERALLPASHIDWAVVQEFAARRPVQVEVTGVRRLSVDEIVARYQAQQRRQDAVVRTTIATGTTTLLFEVPDFAAPITITADTTIFRGPQGTNIEEHDIRVNGAAITGGDAQSPPDLPLIEAERISTPPLVITLDEAYRYALDGEEMVGESRRYVVGFEPRVASRGLARGRAWIDARDFTLRRLETIQKDLRGAIVSSEEVDEFGRVDAGGTVLWLPVETRIFQSFEGAGFETPIHRTIAIRHYEVNSTAFDEQLAAALASDHVMMRDTPEGLRYLVRRGKTGDRAAVSRGTHTIRSIIGGVLVDPGISQPLEFAGFSYVNLNLFGRGDQMSVFFAGVFGQFSWSAPSIRGTRWQAHASAFGIGARYTDRMFRNGREQYAENLLQRPQYASVGVLRSLTPRIRATIDYEFDLTDYRKTASTSPLFAAPTRIVDHALDASLTAERGPWTARAWWNPAMRTGWAGNFQRYGATLKRTVALRSSVTSRVELSWMGGRSLDRFSRYGFDAFDNPLHGYPTASIRYDHGAVMRSATALTWRGLRVDGFGDAAFVHDPGWASVARFYPGVGTAVESGGPFRTLVSVEWAYGFRAPRTTGGYGTQTARITVYKGF